MIKIKNISKSYGSQKILDNISLDVKKGEFISIIQFSIWLQHGEICAKLGHCETCGISVPVKRSGHMGKIQSW